MQPLAESLPASMGEIVGHVCEHFRILLWIVSSWEGGFQVHILPRG